MRRNFALNRIIPVAIGVILAFFVVLWYGMPGKISTAEAQGDQPELHLGEHRIHRGQTFEVPIDVSDNTGLSSMLLIIEYDSDAMTLVGVDRGDAMPTMTMTTYNTDGPNGYAEMPFRILFDATTSLTGNGTVAVLRFDSNIDAPEGDYVIDVEYDPDNTNRSYKNPVALDIEDGIVHITKGNYSVEYLDWDDSVLFEKDYNDGEAPTYPHADPVRDEDECYTYTFNGWVGEISDEIDKIRYRADYAKEAKEYSLFYYVDGLNDDPDGKIDETDFYMGTTYLYDELIDMSYVPSRKDYTFVGWFSDAACTQRVFNMKMPSKNTHLYGYMQYNVRTTEVPKLTMSYTELGGNEVQVDLKMAVNYGINGMVLTLQYDLSQIKLLRFARGMALSDMQFETTNLDNGPAVEDFRFYWEGAVNNYETGVILSMVFDVAQSDKGLYEVGFTYDPTKDATYINPQGEIWYTELEIVTTMIPVGERYHWNEPVGEEDVHIDVTSKQGKPLDVTLLVDVADVAVSDETGAKLSKEKQEINQIYSIELLRNGEKVYSDTELTVKIDLTDEQRAMKNLRICWINENGELIDHPFTIEDGQAVFEMRNIQYWAIIGDVQQGTVTLAAWTYEQIRTVLFPILLAIVTLSYAVLLLAQNTKYKNELKNLKGGKL